MDSQYYSQNRYLLATILSIAATASGTWFKVINSKIYFEFGFFQTKVCEPTGCYAGSGVQSICSKEFVDIPGNSATNACATFGGARATLVISVLVGLVGLVALSFYYFLATPKYARIQSILLLSGIAGMAFFQFLSMCLASSFQSKFTTDVIGLSPRYSLGFVTCIFAWIVGLVAAVGSGLVVRNGGK
ncbi:hypothetical protein HDU97_006261 [Phlyctochytrium planicorne]|nr:hypothetical protein HDU97_006261 [Phlyctochytrium planicorne]